MNSLLKDELVSINNGNLDEFFESVWLKYWRKSKWFRVRGIKKCAIHEIAEVYPNEEPSVERFLTDEIIIRVCAKLIAPNDKKRDARKDDFKHWLKIVVTEAFATPKELLMLNPHYCRLSNIIKFFDFKAPQYKEERITINPISDHPLLEHLFIYQYQNNFRDQHKCQQGSRKFLKWLCGNVPEFKGVMPREVNLSLVNRCHMQHFKEYLELQVERHEVTNVLAVNNFVGVRKWFAFLHDSGLILTNPAVGLWIRKTKVPKKTAMVSVQQIGAFLEAIYLHSPNPLMEVAIFGLYVCTGVRSISALGTQIKDFNPIEKTLRVTLKGGDDHLQLLPSIVVIQIERYLQTRYFKDKENYGEEPLWLNSFNKQVDKKWVNVRFHKYKKLAGITENVGAVHFLRHMYYSQMVEDGNKLDDILISAGPKSVHELEPYIHARQKPMFDKFLDKFKVIKVEGTDED